MAISYKPASLLAFIMAISLVMYYYGISTNDQKLVDATLPFLYIFGTFFVIFLIITIVRNLRSM